MAEGVLTERKGAVAEVRFNRPGKLNAFDPEMIGKLLATMQSLAVDAGVRCVLLTGNGTAFSAGGDLEVMEASLDRGELPQLFAELVAVQEAVIREIVHMPKPVVAALPGVAAGGGLSMALAADWRIGTPDTVLVPAFPQLGAVPDGGLTYFLPHYLGIGLAQELLFTAARIPAERAKELGLLHQIVPSVRLRPESRRRAEELAEGPTHAFGWMKRLMTSAFSQSLEAQMSLERRGMVEAAMGTELPEGIRAFRKKRTPRFL